MLAHPWLCLWIGGLVILSAAVVVGGALVAAGRADESLRSMEPGVDWEGGL